MSATKFDVLILGSGTSSQVPVISCLVAKKPKKGCACCLSTMLPDGSGRKNIRRNTSAIVQFQSKLNLPHTTNRPSTILIDVGKSFCEAAREHFPKHGLDKIDAVLLTHPQLVHPFLNVTLDNISDSLNFVFTSADAINGLDDLRAWTLDAVIQSTIPIYCTQSTFDEVAKIFPYMVNAHGGTGGGDVPAFEWNIITSDVPFDLLGVQISPLKVHHGCHFTSSGQPSTPFECLAFLFDQAFCYMSDVSSIPDSTWNALGYSADSRRIPSTSTFFEESSDDSDGMPISPTLLKSRSASSSSTSISSLQSVDYGLPLLIVDALRLKPHISHFGIAEAVETAVKLRAKRTYILGFTHGVTHDCWEAACELISLASTETYQSDPASPTIQMNDISDPDLGEDPKKFAAVALGLVKNTAKNENIWIRPAFDGLRITTDGEKTADNFYS